MVVTGVKDSNVVMGETRSVRGEPCASAFFPESEHLLLVLLGILEVVLDPDMERGECQLAGDALCGEVDDFFVGEGEILRGLGFPRGILSEDIHLVGAEEQEDVRYLG